VRRRTDYRSAAYEFFAHADKDGAPVWTRNIAERGAVFTHPGNCLRQQMTYCAPLQRYLWWQQLPNRARPDDLGDTRFEGGFGIYDAPEPWGPWTTAYFTDKWDIGPGETASFPAKWMSTDGRTLHLVFSGDDNFSVRKATLVLFDTKASSSSRHRLTARTERQRTQTLARLREPLSHRASKNTCILVLDGMP
jgi:hypothetical protein